MDVKKIRKKSGLTQDQFAVKLGVAPQSVRRWEAGGNVSPMAQKLIRETFGELAK